MTPKGRLTIRKGGNALASGPTMPLWGIEAPAGSTLAKLEAHGYLAALDAIDQLEAHRSAAAASYRCSRVAWCACPIINVCCASCGCWRRHTHRSGRDTVDHGRNGHDDHANAVCGVLRKMSNHLGYDLFNGCLDWDDKPEPINLPLGYTRETYEAELARRARIYANWGKTT